MDKETKTPKEGMFKLIDNKKLKKKLDDINLILKDCTAIEKRLVLSEFTRIFDMSVGSIDMNLINMVTQDLFKDLENLNLPK